MLQDFYFPSPVGVGANVSEALLRLHRLLNTSFTVLPALTFLLSTVTQINATRCQGYPHAPWHPSACPATMGASIAAFNAQLPSIVSEFRSRGYNIRLHDVNSARMGGTRKGPR